MTTTLAEVQKQVLRVLSPPSPNPFSTSASSESPPPPTPILLGHSLESDLKALKICHPLCIDTAIIYHHPRGRPLKPGLAWLTKKWCGREIQARGEGGHDPEEDARACLELLKKKIDNGPSFGEFKTDYESIFERMARSNRRAGGGVGSIKSAVVDHGNPTVMHGSKANTSLGCKDDEEVLKNLLDVLPSHQFVFGRFIALANVMGCKSLNNPTGVKKCTDGRFFRDDAQGQSGRATSRTPTPTDSRSNYSNGEHLEYATQDLTCCFTASNRRCHLHGSLRPSKDDCTQHSQVSFRVCDQGW